jgi:hypothetical protein
MKEYQFIKNIRSLIHIVTPYHESPGSTSANIHNSFMVLPFMNVKWKTCYQNQIACEMEIEDYLEHKESRKSKPPASANNPYTELLFIPVLLEYFARDGSYFSLFFSKKLNSPTQIASKENRT